MEQKRSSYSCFGYISSAYLQKMLLEQAGGITEIILFILLIQNCHIGKMLGSCISTTNCKEAKCHASACKNYLDIACEV